MNVQKEQIAVLTHVQTQLEAIHVLVTQAIIWQATDNRVMVSVNYIDLLHACRH